MNDDQPTIPPREPGEIVSRAATVDARKAVKIEHAVTVDRPRMELYRLWRGFDQLPRYFEDLETVTSSADGHTHWVLAIPTSQRIEWDSEIVNDIPGELIAWKTIGDSDVAHAGSVHFRDVSGEGTEVRVVIDYEPPGGRTQPLVGAFTHLFGGAPAAKLAKELRAFKEKVEKRAD